MSTKPFNARYKSFEYSETLPVSGKSVSFRPYTVLDERTLAAAAEAKQKHNDTVFYVTNTLNVIQSTILNEVDIANLPSIDVRWLLLKQRSKSVGGIVDFMYGDKKFSINIDEFFIDGKRDRNDYKIDLGDGFGVEMKDLPFEQEMYASANSGDEKVKRTDIFYNLIMNSIHSIFDKDDVWVVGTDITVKQAEEFINTVPTDKSKPIYDFVYNAPKIAIKIDVDGQELTVSDRDVDFLSSAQAI